ncbi:transglycosylase domain-containing protein [Actinoalloteichus spitiensis]|uniref:transglycosylase domain-containing protein n=1 Tax=Actinoalloteichus spitiensis TaxID=252394 RepID=UPI00035F8502|nr:transglycosylase domain-containing protein [Actinoalloteichus spitiensis]
MILARAKGASKLLGLCLIAGVLLAAVFFPAAAGFGAVSNQAADTVSGTSAEMESAEPAVVTTVTDRDDNPIAYLYHQNRVMVGPDEISDEMKAAIVAVEDHRFFDHDGVDWQATFRVAVQNQFAGRIEGGGSTLTQQYVKNYLAFIVGDGDEEAFGEATEATMARKLREARIALDIEKRMTKDEILTGYLNIVPFGNETYGVHQAARTYFDTTPDQLNLPQAALLAAVVNAPSVLNPGRNPEDAQRRRNLVLNRMGEEGMLGATVEESRQVAEEAKQEPLGVVNPLNRLPNGCVGHGNGDVNGFFCSYVMNYLREHGFDDEDLKRNGYTIKTTLDPVATQAAKAAAEEEVAKTTPGVANVMAVVEPGRESHKVRALVANRDYGVDSDRGQTSWDLPSAVMPFGTGSTYKIFTAAAGLEQGYKIHQEFDSPESYTSSVYRNGTNPYVVTGGMGHKVSLQDSLAHSPNTTFVQMSEEIGLDNVVDMAYRLGLRKGMDGVNHNGTGIDPDSDDPRVSMSQRDFLKQNNMGAFTLGFTPTSVLELANVSATLTSGGVWCPPSPIESITDKHGNPVEIEEQPCEQAVDEGLANSMVVALSKDDTVGTAANAANVTGWNRPAIGKTGTTQGHRSAAFTGATPQMAGAVLIFGDSASPQPICSGPPVTECGVGNIYGGHAPARTWFRAMNVILEGTEVAGLPQADPRHL